MVCRNRRPHWTGYCLISMELIAPGVFQLTKMVNSFIIDGDDGVVLIDTGLPKKQGAIVHALGSIGRRIDEVAAIVLTHAHSDHTGGAAALQLESGAAVIASVVDAPVVRGDQPIPPPPIFDFPFLRSLVATLVPAADPVGVPHVVESGPVPLVSDLVAIATPGHTAGHISLLLDRSDGVMFAGDSAMARAGKVTRGFMNRKTATFDASLRAMAEQEFDIACFGHSPPIETHAHVAFKDFVAAM